MNNEAGPQSGFNTKKWGGGKGRYAIKATDIIKFKTCVTI